MSVHFIEVILIPSCGVHGSLMFHESEARKEIENEGHKEREKKGRNLKQSNIGSKLGQHNTESN